MVLRCVNGEIIRKIVMVTVSILDGEVEYLQYQNLPRIGEIPYQKFTVSYNFQPNF